MSKLESNDAASSPTLFLMVLLVPLTNHSDGSCTLMNTSALGQRDNKKSGWAGGCVAPGRAFLVTECGSYKEGSEGTAVPADERSPFTW